MGTRRARALSPLFEPLAPLIGVEWEGFPAEFFAGVVYTISYSFPKRKEGILTGTGGSPAISKGSAGATAAMRECAEGW